MNNKSAHSVLLFFTIAMIFAVTTSAYAFTESQWWQERTWHPVMAVGMGSATSSNIGNSQYFPILSPATDQFYNYSNNSKTQTSAVYNGFLGVEWNLRPNWTSQIGMEYNQTSPFYAQGTLTQGADVSSQSSYTYYYGLFSRQLLAEGKLLYLLKERYHPYILAGLGASFNKAYNYYTTVPPFITFTRMYQNSSTSAFSYAIGLGMDVDLSSNLRLGIGYRFSDLGQVSLGNATIESASASGTLAQSHLYSNELLAQLTLII